MGKGSLRGLAKLGAWTPRTKKLGLEMGIFNRLKPPFDPGSFGKGNEILHFAHQHVASVPASRCEASRLIAATARGHERESPPGQAVRCPFDARVASPIWRRRLFSYPSQAIPISDPGGGEQSASGFQGVTRPLRRVGGAWAVADTRRLRARVMLEGEQRAGSTADV